MSSRSSLFAPSFASSAFLSCLFLAVSISVSTPLTAAAQSATAAVEVVYVLEGATLETYNVDRQTGYATEQGQGVTLEASTGNTTVVASPNDHFLYITGYSGSEYLWVYSTDANGVPQTPPVQTVSLGSSYSPLAIDPDGSLAYITESTTNSQGEMVVAIYA
jgi:DNA-binding beta-propeller fold protein YncE